MVAVRIYFMLVMVLLGTCFQAGESFWWSRSSCRRVNCTWSSWTSWGSCNHYCSKFNMQRRTRCVTRNSACGGRSCSGPSKEIRICSCRISSDCITFPNDVLSKIPSQCC